MEWMISGYGKKPTPTMSLCTLAEDNTIKSSWQSSVDNPSFLCQGDGILFTVTEDDEYASVYSYRKTAAGYEPVDDRRIEGGALCHITYSTRQKALFGACYGTGTLFALHVEQGKFGLMFHHEIQGIPITRAHCVLLNRAEDKLYTVNIALDCIFLYTILQDKLVLNTIIETPKGSGPRHAVLSDSEQLIYIITEYSNEILVYENGGEYRLLQKISTLSDDFRGTSNCSTLCFSKDRRFLYAANRGADTVAVFSVKKDGLLEWLSEQDCGGKHPRHMLVTKDGQQLIVCNQNSDLVTVFNLNTDTGIITGKRAEYPFPAPSGILEV